MSTDKQDWLDSQEPADPTCPECGGKMKLTWEGDPEVINGTRDLLVCKDCGIITVPADSPVAITEQLFDFARRNGLME